MELALRLKAGLGLGLSAMGAALTLATAPGPQVLAPRPEGTAQASTRAHNDGPYALTPERQALLNTIRYAEGTWKNGSSLGYRVLYGGALADNLQEHPRQVVVKRYTSAAAGAYQFLPQTWDMAASTLNLNDFGPRSQDQAALFLIDRRQALDEADNGRLTPELVAKLAPEWASLPTMEQQSFYGQPVKDFEELNSFYQENLEELRRSGLPQQEPGSGLDTLG
ncbi:MAG: glycoside hydrolase family 104 protein [Cyanobacteriota bacterium]|nr:glycoside hydrolase family 104 protein [Cyanobacteriota bacterium]